MTDRSVDGEHGIVSNRDFVGTSIGGTDVLNDLFRSINEYIADAIGL